MEDKASALIAAGGGLATIITAIGEVTVQILGVPLPVVLAAGTGAWIARSYTPATNLGRAVIATLGWTVAGCVLAPLAQAVVKHFFSAELPTNALAGLALIVSLAMPFALPIFREKGPEVLRSWFDAVKKGGKS